MTKHKKTKLSIEKKKLEIKFRKHFEEYEDITKEEIKALSRETISKESLPDIEEMQDKLYFEIGKECLRRIKDKDGTRITDGNSEGDGFYNIERTKSGRDLKNTMNREENAIKGHRKKYNKANTQYNQVYIDTQNEKIDHYWEDIIMDM